MTSIIQSPLFTQRVVQAMRSLYPEELADRAWDNVGLLQENIDYSQSPSSAARDVSPIVLLTNDLTVRVAEEAIRKRASVIVSYHPFIFRGLKSISLGDPQQRIMLQLAQHNIAVYCPHTAVDAAPGGMNDWLADMLDGHGVTTKRSVVQPTAVPVPPGFGGAGFGRLVEFGHVVNLGRIVEAYAEGLGGLRYVMVARPKQSMPHLIRSVAICAGSGYDVLKDCTTADLIVTGEMTHHNALRLTMLGRCVLTVFHSNSERRFLKKRLQPQLHGILASEDAETEVLVSEEDEDPFEIWDVKNMPLLAYDKK
ncbi:GTP cyclohydrolase 1 type 2/Nif3 [Lasiosphaeria miniovina]|uniref:GTP cyclohydrolase 1 type 2/Nif3 n=1 Tax=Lasiosphaeria miniovina TaxID=1954250 RepID=A0AA40ABX1_9PEZI|nr:GTP cyclohydrolase 1 type 2/Nif3 [Lasiosphaeria miniovina]KAK0713067.1 GTP cyclohydrolase 1 type 2/Nif3 [Lasiosphaeria miniovina]